MGSFGENLRREREMRGVSLEEISAATKISVRFLQCVENEEFGKLPGGIFVRSFIRAYARYLGLDEEALLAEYQLVAKDKGGPDISRLAAARPSPRSARSGWKVFGAFILICILAAAGFALWRYSQRRAAARARAVLASHPPLKAGAEPSAKPSAAQTSPKSAPGANPSAGAATSPQQSAASAAPGGNGATPSTPAASTLGSGSLQLQIAATERSWVAVDSDGKTVLQGILEPGQVKNIRADNSFDVVTGNAQGIVLTLNGQTLKPLGQEGEVKSVHLTRDDLKNPGQ